MGLNFRKSISILPGVKVNLSKGGVSLSAGVPGFRKSINTKGQVRTTASIPGTGIYYTDTKKVFGNSKSKKEEKEKEESKKKKSAKEETKSEKKAQTKEKKTAARAETKPKEAQAESLAASESRAANIPQYSAPATEPKASAVPFGAAAAVRTGQAPVKESAPAVQPPQAAQPAPAVSRQVSFSALKSIHKLADDTIDWDEIAASPTAPDPSYNQEMWSYYHSLAPKVLGGDIDTYLKLIYEVNPLDDLLEYGKNFEFGTDDPAKIEVEYVVNEELLTEAKNTLVYAEYNELLQDFIGSMSIRVARDMFALLPVSSVMVYAVMDNRVMLCVDFDRETLSKVRFGMIDPSDTVDRFPATKNFPK